jgi:reactive intermediate/imine deaminase
MQISQVTAEPDNTTAFLHSQAIRAGDFLFVSGQASIDDHGRLVHIGDFDAQAAQTFRNLDRVLRAGGSSLSRIVKVTIFLTDMGNFPKIVELRRKHFSAPYPADTLVEVSSLFSKDAMIEIEAIAVVG